LGKIDLQSIQITKTTGKMNNNSDLQRQLRSMEARMKKGWRAYYCQREYNDALAYTLNEERRRMAMSINDGSEEIDISHLKHLFLELYDKVKEFVECPICMHQVSDRNTPIFRSVVI
jgi:hypothetical protein